MSRRLRSATSLARPTLDRSAVKLRSTAARQTLEVVVREPSEGAVLDVRLVDARVDRSGRRTGRWEARVEVSATDGTLCDAVAAAIGAALRAAGPVPEPSARTVRVRTRKAARALGPEGLRGAIALVLVTEGNARRIPDIVEAVRAADPLGVQIVWDGTTPARAIAEPSIVAALERARATLGPPVVLAPNEDVAFVFRFLAEPGRSPASPEAPLPGAWSLEPGA